MILVFRLTLLAIGSFENFNSGMLMFLSGLTILTYLSFSKLFSLVDLFFNKLVFVIIFFSLFIKDIS